jgi:polar amino acid transport system substrate-binding protein
MRIRSIALLSVAGVVACNLPRDPDDTLDHIRGQTLRVGVVENPPWVSFSGDSVGGIEGDLVAELARGLGAKTEWVHGSDSELLAGLEHGELHLVIGGLTADIPWKAKVALTQPYYTDTIALSARAGAPIPRDLEGEPVGVEADDLIDEYVAKRGGRPTHVRDLGGETGLVAAPMWKLARLERHAMPEDGSLHEAEHVLAAVPGENAWLVHIERFLRDRESTIPALLRARAP